MQVLQYRSLSTIQNVKSATLKEKEGGEEGGCVCHAVPVA